MKVTFVGTLPPVKAISHYCYFLAVSLSKMVEMEFIGFKDIIPEFLYSGGTKENSESNTILKNVETKTLISWYNPLSWIKAGLQCNGDIVHLQHWVYYSSFCYCVILPILKIRGKKIVLTIHNILPHTDDKFSIFIDRVLNKILFPFTEIFIVHNQRNKKKLMDLYKIKEDRIFIATHGTLKPYGRITGVSKSTARERFHIPKEKKVLLFFGYLWEYKGVDDLLQSLVFITQKRKDVLLVIAGQPLKNWDMYEKIIKDNNLDEYVIRKLGYIVDSDIEYFFSCADLVVLPYKLHPFDTHGGVGALAIFFKKPVVVTDVGGLPEYVKDKRAVSNPNDPIDIANKIIHILEDKNLLKKLSRDSEELSNELNWDAIAEKTYAIYEKMLK
jgi:glycosyltransferase involved in cell wall biosynthesis